LYEKVKYFIQNELFDKKVNLEDLNILRNLSEIEATRTIIETFKKEINDLTIQDKGDSEIRNYIKISKCRPFVVKDQGYLVPKKSVFNKIIGDSHLELRFANFLETCDDIISYVKNYFGVHFKIDYKNADGNISDYYPDFVVKKNDKEVFIIETKGREDLDVPLKTQRLKQWCEDLNKAQKKVKYDFIYVDEESFDKYHPSTFEELEKNFREYKD
jgi:type III restriction enzyme